MLRKFWTELCIDTSLPLPGADEAPALPKATAVINYLEMRCGLNPFRFPKPVEGAFERMHTNHRLMFTARFEDFEDRSICTLHPSIRV